MLACLAFVAALVATPAPAAPPLNLPWTCLLDAEGAEGAEGKARVPPEALERIEATRRPARRITGRVARSDGSAVAGLLVAAAPVEPQYFAQHAEFVKAPPAATVLAPGWEALLAARAFAAATSDDKGNFALVIDEGAWSVAACEPSGWCSAAVTVPMKSDVPQRPIELVLRRRRLAAVEVRDDLGAPVAGALVIARERIGPNEWKPREAEELARVTTDSSGRALLSGLPLQAFDLEGSAPGLAPARIEATGDGLLALTLPHVATLTVALVADDEEPLQDATARILRPPAPGDKSLRWSRDGEPVAAGDAGIAVLRDVTPGLLVVEASARGRFPATCRILDVKPGQQVAAGQITLARGALVSGIVRDALTEEPVADAEVTVVGRDDKTRSRKDGLFELGPFAPGAWRLNAVREGYPASPASGVEVVIKTEDEARGDVEIALMPGGDLTVRLRDADGRPIAGARVRATCGQDRAGAREGTTDDAGEVTWTTLPAGPATVSVVGWNSASASVSFGTVADAPAARPPAAVTVAGGRLTVADVVVGGLRLFGTVTVGGEPTPARVVPEGWASSTRMQMEPSPEYVLAGLPAGRVKLLVDTPKDGTWETFSRTPLAVEIPPGVSALRHDIALPATTPGEPEPMDLVRVPGTLVDAATKEPMAGWFVQVPGVGLFPADALGRFELLLPPNGAFDAFARSSNMRYEWTDGVRNAEGVRLRVVHGEYIEPGLPLTIEVAGGPLVTMRVLDRAGIWLSGVTCVALADPPRRASGSARLAISDPLGRAVLRVEEPGDVAVLVTDGASFRTVVGPVRFGAETERVVNVPPTGALRIVGVTNETTLQCDGWPVSLPALAAGWDYNPLASSLREGNVVTVTQRGLPVGDCRVAAGETRRTARIVEGETATIDLR